MDELGQIIEFSNFVLISCSIQKDRLKQVEPDQNPYHLALGYCMETLYEFLQEKGQEQFKTHVVVEQRGRKEDNELELELRRICDGNNQLHINMPFDVIFSDKKVMSTGLQLADLVARPIGLHTIRPKQENKAFEILKHKFYCEGGRDKTGKGYKGVGMKVYPAQESEKPR